MFDRVSPDGEEAISIQRSAKGKDQSRWEISAGYNPQLCLLGVKEEPMSNAYEAENNAGRAELSALIDRLTDAQLTQPMPAGWTPAAVLAHLAFWDQRALTLLRQWKEGGVAPSPIDTHLINEVTRVLFLAIPPRAAAELALRCAEEIDREIAALDPTLLAEVETKGTTVVLNRARHRRIHLDEIKQALGEG
jgi:hypothetical protein